MAKPRFYSKEIVRRLEDIPNVGKGVARYLRSLGVKHPEALKRKDPRKLHDALCKKTGIRQDPCLLDVFTAAVDYVDGAPAHPWWHYTPERKRLRSFPSRIRR